MSINEPELTLEERQIALGKKIADRPKRESLVETNILKDTSASPLIQAAQADLRRKQIEDELNEKLVNRPGPLDLMAENIILGSDEGNEKRSEEENMKEVVVQPPTKINSQQKKKTSKKEKKIKFKYHEYQPPVQKNRPKADSNPQKPTFSQNHDQNNMSQLRRQQQEYLLAQQGQMYPHPLHGKIPMRPLPVGLPVPRPMMPAGQGAPGNVNLLQQQFQQQLVLQNAGNMRMNPGSPGNVGMPGMPGVGLSGMDMGMPLDDQKVAELRKSLQSRGYPQQLQNRLQGRARASTWGASNRPDGTITRDALIANNMKQRTRARGNTVSARPNTPTMGPQMRQRAATVGREGMPPMLQTSLSNPNLFDSSTPNSGVSTSALDLAHPHPQSTPNLFNSPFGKSEDNLLAKAHESPTLRPFNLGDSLPTNNTNHSPSPGFDNNETLDLSALLKGNEGGHPGENNFNFGNQGVGNQPSTGSQSMGNTSNDNAGRPGSLTGYEDLLKAYPLSSNQPFNTSDFNNDPQMTNFDLLQERQQQGQQRQQHQQYLNGNDISQQISAQQNTRSAGNFLDDESLGFNVTF
eukprot:Nk52_evm1s242 gene=Nk52_evmTU1s242